METAPQNNELCEKEVERLLKEKNLKDLIGMSRTKFKKILRMIRNALQFRNARGDMRECIETRKKISRSERTHLFITLLWLRNYFTDDVIAALFHLSNFALNRMIKRTLNALDESLPDIKWPTDEEFEQPRMKFIDVLPDEFGNMFLVVDGTEIPVRRPKNRQLQKQLYSTKKKQYSLTVILIVTLDGRIKYISESLISSSDQHHWNQLKLRDLFVNKPYGVIGDGGFTFNPKSSPNNESHVQILGATRTKRPPHGELINEQKRRNRIISSIRAVVENTIAQMKNWKILATGFRHFSGSRKNQIDFELVVRVVAKLTALQIEHRPLRRKGWKISIPQIQ